MSLTCEEAALWAAQRREILNSYYKMLVFPHIIGAGSVHADQQVLKQRLHFQQFFSAVPIPVFVKLRKCSRSLRIGLFSEKNVGTSVR